MGESPVIERGQSVKESVHVSPEFIVTLDNLAIYNEIAGQHDDVQVEVRAQPGKSFKAVDSHGPLNYFDGIVPEKHALIRIKSLTTPIDAILIAFDEHIQKKVKGEIKLGTETQHRGLTF